MHLNMKGEPQFQTKEATRRMNYILTPTTSFLAFEWFVEQCMLVLILRMASIACTICWALNGRWWHLPPMPSKTRISIYHFIASKYMDSIEHDSIELMINVVKLILISLQPCRIICSLCIHPPVVWFTIKHLFSNTRSFEVLNKVENNFQDGGHKMVLVLNTFSTGS